MELMESYEWPGNVRELKGVVDYAATMATGSLLTPDSLPSFLYAKERRAIYPILCPETGKASSLLYFSRWREI